MILEKELKVDLLHKDFNIGIETVCTSFVGTLGGKTVVSGSTVLFFFPQQLSGRHRDHCECPDEEDHHSQG